MIQFVTIHGNSGLNEQIPHRVHSVDIALLPYQHRATDVDFLIPQLR